MKLLRFRVILACIGVSLSLSQVACDTLSGGAGHTAVVIRSGTDFLPPQTQAINAFIDDMVARHGFDKTILQSQFADVERSEKALRLMVPGGPTQAKDWQAYRARIVDPRRIAAGLVFWDDYEEELARAEQEYGVPAEIIVGIIGVETYYGRITGSYRVMDVLTTLAFEYPEHPRREARMAFFRQQLEQVLLFARESSIDPLALNGSYAGAIGLPQFMPGSIRQFGVDFDGDSRVDLIVSPEDAIGSVANYLEIHGWKRGEGIVVPAMVKAPDTSDLDNLTRRGLTPTLDLTDLQNEGVHPAVPLPPNMSDVPYGLVDLENGESPAEYWIAADNFYAITKYNRSYFYAMSVVELGKAIKQAREPALVYHRRD